MSQAPPIVLERAPGFAAAHGVATRAGGVSAPPFDTLNLGGGVGDEPEAVHQNRSRFLEAIGAPAGEVCVLHQVHGTRIVPWHATWFREQADAAIALEPGQVLTVSAADCWPVLVRDPSSGAVGAAHAGWRGTVAGIAGRLVRTLAEATGGDVDGFEASLGPGICGACYQIGADVADAVVDGLGAGARTALGDDPEVDRWRLDLEALLRRDLQGAGIRPERIHRLGGCTHHHDARYFSHRRDAGATGRHWAWIRAGGRR